MTPPGFAPSTIEGLSLWYDFSDSTTLFVDAGITQVTADSDPIFQVNDKSGNLRHATQITSDYRPLYKTSIKNNKSVARFDGSNDRMDVPSFTWFANSTVFIVAKRTSNAAFGGLFNADGAAPRMFQLNYNTGVDEIRQITWDGVIQSTAPCSPVGTYDIISARRRASTTGGDEVFVNGVPGLSVNSSTAALGPRVYSLGSYEGATYALPGDICELVVFNTALSAINHNRIGNYLAQKWGLTWSWVDEFPSNIPGLIGWYDFSDASSMFTNTGRTTAVTGDGDLIKGVTEKSASVAHLSEASTPPTYKTNIFNGRSVARFDRGTTTKLETSVAALCTALNGNDTPFSLYAVFGPNAGASGNMSNIAWGYTLDNNHINVRPWLDKSISIAKETAGSPGQSVAETAGAISVGQQYVFVYVSPGTTISCWRDNNLLVNAASFDQPSITLNRFTLGTINIAGSYYDYASSDIGEVVAYLGAHSDAQRQQIQSYLANKWGVTLA